MECGPRHINCQIRANLLDKRKKRREEKRREGKKEHKHMVSKILLSKIPAGHDVKIASFQKSPEEKADIQYYSSPY